MVKNLLFFFLFLLAVPMAIAQTPPPTCPSGNTPAADNCQDACIYCNLVSYTGTTIGYSNGVAAGFCGTIESEQWLGFVAGANAATITVMPSNCFLGNGVQVAIYDDCFGTPIPNGCNGGTSGGGNTPVSVTVGLTPGTVYYLMVDSWAGDLCDFSINVSPPGAAIGLEFETQAGVFCPGGSVTIDGIVFTQAGTYSYTYPSMNGGCDTLRTYKITALPQPTLSQTIVLQIGETVAIGGNTYSAPDTVQTTISASAGCDTLATYFLELSPLVPDTCIQTRGFLKLLGEAGASERAEVLCASADGNLYIAGEKGAQSLLMKVTSDGDVLWSRTFRPAATLTTHISDLVEDSEGMLVGCATVGDGDANLKGYAFRYNPVTGNFIWSRLLEQQSPEAYTILEKTPGGNYLLLTSPQLAQNVDDVEIWEINRNNGTLVGGLANRFNLGVSDVWNSMVVQDGALYTIGRHIPTFQSIPVPIDKMRMGLSKIDLANPGSAVWSRLSHRDTSTSATLFGQDLLIDGNALVSIHNGNDTGDPNASPKFFLQKTTLDGNLLWVKSYDTPTPATNLASDIQRMSDGYVIIGWVLDGAFNKFIVKVDFDGNVLWSKRVTNTSVSNAANALTLGQHQSVVVNNVLYLVASSADIQTDAILIKMTSDGEVSDVCGSVVPTDFVAAPVVDPVNTPVQVPASQFIRQSVSAPVTADSTQMLVSTSCVSCLQDCDDTLDIGPDIILCKDSTLTFNAGSGFVNYHWQDGSSDSTFTTNMAGVYWVEVTDECGDKQRDSVLLTFSLVGDIKLSDTTLCVGESLTLSVPGFDIYDWSPSDGLDCDTCSTITIQTDITTTYTLYAENEEGCVKFDTFTLVVLPLQTLSETIQFCPGESVVIGGIEYTQSGTVFDTIPGTIGCDTIVIYTLTLLPYNTGAQTISLCPGESVTIGGIAYTQSGTVIDTIPGTAGCDTIVTYTLVLLPYNTGTQTIEFCPGESVTIGGIAYTQSGTVIDTIPGTAGCDTIVTYTLILLPYNTAAQTIQFCPGESVTIDGVVYTQSGTVIDTIPGTIGCDTIVTYTLILLPYNTGTQTIQFCPGESVTIGGIVYTQSGTVIDTIPGTAGCDTIVTYTLILLPYNTAAQTIQFCPGESVTIDGVVYTQSGTVVDTIPGTVGCDSIVTYTLILLPQPTRSETIEFCSGESVTIGGNIYTQPGTVIDTIPASAGCDTIVTYTLKFIDTPNSSVSIDCPADIDVAIDPGDGPVVVNYNLPTVSSDCECPGISLTRTQGLASGSLFPVGTTTVCYSAKDSCGNTATCCFLVYVREESACDIKTIGCLKWELLDITKDAENDLTYRIRVTNSCANKLIYTAIQIPDGLVAVAPANNSVFTAPSGRQYDVRNPNYSPFYSIRFKSQTDSIANGQSDILKYKLPGQTLPAYIHVNARLAPQIFYEAHLNTFNCPVGVTPADNRPADKRQNPENLSGFKVFPNPTSGALYADFSDWQGEQLQVLVYSSQGQRIQLLTLQAEDTPQQVALPEGLSAGLYFLEVWRTNGEKQTVRFVVQR